MVKKKKPTKTQLIELLKYSGCGWEKIKGMKTHKTMPKIMTCLSKRGAVTRTSMFFKRNFVTSLFVCFTEKHELKYIILPLDVMTYNVDLATATPPGSSSTHFPVFAGLAVFTSGQNGPPTRS